MDETYDQEILCVGGCGTVTGTVRLPKIGNGASYKGDDCYGFVCGDCANPWKDFCALLKPTEQPEYEKFRQWRKYSSEEEATPSLFSRFTNWLLGN